MSEHEQAPVNVLQEKFVELVKKIADWAVLIVMLVLPGLIDSYAVVYGIAFGLGVVLMSINGYRYSKGNIKVFPKVFEGGVIVVNLALLAFEFLAKPSHDWSKNWASVIINSALLVLVLFSILIKRPFTLQFAMEKVPEKFWKTEAFFSINNVISWVWALQFILAVMFSILYIFVYNDNELLRIIPGLVILALTLQFTAEFPTYMRRRKALQQNSSPLHTTTGDYSTNPLLPEDTAEVLGSIRP
jgi:hypothetical protein